MSKKCVDKYVPKFVQHFELPWYERDGLISYFDALKCEEFLRDTDSHFKNDHVGNFDIIHHKCRGDLLEGSYKEYKTINKEDICNWTRTHNHLVHKGTLNHLAKLASLAKWLSVRL